MSRWRCSWLGVTRVSKVDKSTEEWLDKIENRADYGKWYCGHYYTEKKIDKLEIMFENVRKFGVGG